MGKIKNKELLEIKKEIQKEIQKEKERDRFFALDLETTTWKESNTDLTPIKPIFGVLTEFHPESFKKILQERVFEAKEIMDLLESLVNKHSHSANFVYVHNLDFDFLFLLAPFMNLPEIYRINPIIVGSRLIKVSVMKRTEYKDKVYYRTLVEFRNTFCLISKSLRKIGQELGFEKFENEFETIDEGLITEKDIEYCKRDNLVVIKLLENWVKTMNSIGLNKPIEEITLTSASTAFKLFKELNSEERMNSEGKIEKFCKYILDSAEMNKEFRPFYFGGRTEVFDFNMAESVDYFDINSLYPSVMIDLNVPIPPYYPFEGFKEDINTFAFEIEIDESNQEIPLFPERMVGKVCFTARTKSVFAFAEEIEYLKSINQSFKIVKTWTTKSGFDKPFKYIADLYSLRKQKESEGQKGMAGAIKIIMNSTYGRFALQTEREMIKTEKFVKKHADEYTDIYQDIGIIKNTEEIPAELNVLIACKITALARLTITKQARNVIAKGLKVYYMDTDSLVVSKGSIPESKALGGFKVEESFEWFQAISAKDYCAKTPKDLLFKTKGSRIKDFEEYIKYHKEGLLNIRPSKLKEMLDLYRQAKISTLEPIQRNILKKYISVYDKRVINEDLTTRPIKSEESIESVKINNAEKMSMVFERLVEKLKEEGKSNEN